jgi:hypothetical protein
MSGTEDLPCRTCREAAFWEVQGKERGMNGMVPDLHVIRESLRNIVQ